MLEDQLKQYASKWLRRLSKITMEATLEVPPFVICNVVSKLKKYSIVEICLKSMQRAYKP